MLYNARRFGTPFEFGQHYQLSGIRQDTVRHFSPSYLWFNFRVYFLEPMRWRADFPFVTNIRPPPLPPGHGIVEQPFSPFGVLANLPFTLAALAAPLAWRRRRAQPALAGAITGAAVLFGAPALVTLFFFGTCSRYESEFLPGLVLLAALGVLALEAAPLGPGLRRAVRAAWVSALLFSVAFTLCASLERAVLEHGYAGHTLSDLGRQPEAIDQLQDALRIRPGDVDARIDLGVAWARAGRLPEAVAAFQAAVQADPRRIEARDDLGNGLVQLGRFAEGIAQYQAGLRFHPESAQTHYNLAVAWLRTGRTAEAKLEYDRAVALNPGLGRR
jgi:tetratricopeptide (TPR) repeat protein